MSQYLVGIIMIIPFVIIWFCSWVQDSYQFRKSVLPKWIKKLEKWQKKKFGTKQKVWKFEIGNLKGSLEWPPKSFQDPWHLFKSIKVLMVMHYVASPLLFTFDYSTYLWDILLLAIGWNAAWYVLWDLHYESKRVEK